MTKILDLYLSWPCYRCWNNRFQKIFHWFSWSSPDTLQNMIHDSTCLNPMRSSCWIPRMIFGMVPSNKKKQRPWKMAQFQIFPDDLSLALWFHHDFPHDSHSFCVGQVEDPQLDPLDPEDGVFKDHNASARHEEILRIPTRIVPLGSGWISWGERPTHFLTPDWSSHLGIPKWVCRLLWCFLDVF